MKKIFKIILIVVMSIIIFLGVNLIIDSIRFKRLGYGTKPIIVLNKENYVQDDGHTLCTKYTGLGYTIEYSYMYDEPTDEGIIPIIGRKTILKLFDNKLLWSWIE